MIYIHLKNKTIPREYNLTTSATPLRLKKRGQEIQRKMGNTHARHCYDIVRYNRVTK